MKKLFRSVTLVLALSLVMSMTVMASPQKSEFNVSELKLAQDQAYEMVLRGEAEQADSNPTIKKFKNYFEQNPEAYAEYINTLDVLNQDKVNAKLANSEFTTTADGKLVMRMNDGSFLVTHNTLTDVDGNIMLPESPLLTNAVIQDTKWQTYSATIGEKFTNDARHDFWGTHKMQEIPLVTKYTVNSTAIQITDTSTTGTASWFPGTVEPGTPRVLSNNAREVEATCGYKYGGLVDWGSFSKSASITTSLKVNYAGSGSISFSVRSIVEG
ncbi:hypothetical protein [Paenibacillus alvei]|uniref:hypothetical protein n=1 Tax=Paenibacillus alvei TaxID=44250 RepID=UPI000385E614|nr:hypothetical protein [Paenibacillus alvei]EPY12833.1 hypothetical protein PAAL66ix_10616 [Paenibacillus alvei A6-6i-x]